MNAYHRGEGCAFDNASCAADADGLKCVSGDQSVVVLWVLQSGFVLVQARELLMQPQDAARVFGDDSFAEVVTHGECVLF